MQTTTAQVLQISAPMPSKFANMENRQAVVIDYGGKEEKVWVNQSSVCYQVGTTVEVGFSGKNRFLRPIGGPSPAAVPALPRAAAPPKTYQKPDAPTRAALCARIDFLAQMMSHCHAVIFENPKMSDLGMSDDQRAEAARAIFCRLAISENF